MSASNATNQGALFPEFAAPDLSKRPKPPVWANLDLTGADWFKLHFRRLRQSNFWRKCPAAHLRLALEAWFVSWDQIPATSLPADLDQIARLVGASPRELAAGREWILYGWRLHSDGRLYHRFLAALANERGRLRRDRSHAGRKGAAARWGEEQEEDADSRAGSRDALPARDARVRGSGAMAGLLPSTHYETGENAVMPLPSEGAWQKNGRGEKSTEIEEEEDSGQKDYKKIPAAEAEPSRAYAHEGFAWQSRHAPERHLTPRDFAGWAAAFHRVDLLAEITSLDEWAALNLVSAADRKRWFHVFSAALKRKHDEAGGTAQPKPNGAPPRREPTAREINSYVPKDGEPESLCDDWPF